MGYPHPDHLLKGLSSPQLSELLAYYGLEPFGERTEFLRTGIVAATIANVNRGKGQKAFSPEDFMPKEPKIEKPQIQTVEEQKSILQGIASWAKKRGLTKKNKAEK